MQAAEGSAPRGARSVNDRTASPSRRTATLRETEQRGVAWNHRCGVRCARTSRTSWSLCVAGTTSAEAERSARLP
jgi:hypothetical protein